MHTRIYERSSNILEMVLKRAKNGAARGINHQEVNAAGADRNQSSIRTPGHCSNCAERSIFLKGHALRRLYIVAENREGKKKRGTEEHRR